MLPVFIQHQHLKLPAGNYRSRRQLHFVPADWAPWLARPRLSLSVACPSISITLLHGSLHEGVSGLGRPALRASRPWAEAAPTGPTPLLDIRLPHGIEARHIGHRVASCVEVDVPALAVTTSAAASVTMPTLAPLSLLDLSGLHLSVRAFLANCHWVPVSGLDSAFMGVAENNRNVAVSVQRLDLGAHR